MNGTDAETRPWLPATRAEAEAQLDALVRDNRFTISVLFPVVGAVLLVASAEGVPEAALAALLRPLGAADLGRAVGRALTFNPWLVLTGIAVMRAPLLVGLAPVTDRRVLGGVAALAAYAYAIELTGVHTGWPYGAFSYGVDLGPVVAGVPLALPLLFLPLVLNAYLLALLLLGDHGDRAHVRVPAVIAGVLLVDLVLDPGAVALGFWSYDAGGAYYGVPLTNFAGWALSATVAVAVFDRALPRAAVRERLSSCEFLLDDMVSFVVLWGAVNLWFGALVPVCLATAFGLGLVRVDRFDTGLFRQGIDQFRS